MCGHLTVIYEGLFSLVFLLVKILLHLYCYIPALFWKLKPLILLDGRPREAESEGSFPIISLKLVLMVVMPDFLWIQLVPLVPFTRPNSRRILPWPFPSQRLRQHFRKISRGRCQVCNDLKPTQHPFSFLGRSRCDYITARSKLSGESKYDHCFFCGLIISAIYQLCSDLSQVDVKQFDITIAVVDLGKIVRVHISGHKIPYWSLELYNPGMFRLLLSAT